MNKWYIINTKPHAEFRVIDYLATKNIKTFMPKLMVTRKHARKIENVLRPLFPSYLFVYINLENSYRIVSSSIGVKSILSTGSSPSPVPDNVINELNQYTDCRGLVTKIDTSRFKTGQQVKINHGIFKGSVANFCAMSGKERVSILLELLGKQVKISISSLYISAA